MKANIPPLQTETYYHIYNRGINSENIFKQPVNYNYFLKKYALFITSVADTYAFCLLKNHFHFLIKTKSEPEIQDIFSSKEKSSTSLISLQFSHLFNGYTQAINKSTNRTGSLFETPFRRKAITEEEYLRRLIFYIHYNPEKHGLYNNFKEYQFSSYQALISDKFTNLKRAEVISWFGDVESFELFHSDLKPLDVDLIAFE
jgi:REP element-mobilizing transposase RayT